MAVVGPCIGGKERGSAIESLIDETQGTHSLCKIEKNKRLRFKVFYDVVMFAVVPKDRLKQVHDPSVENSNGEDDCGQNELLFLS